jgi:hypothetical protein
MVDGLERCQVSCVIVIVVVDWGCRMGIRQQQYMDYRKS